MHPKTNNSNLYILKIGGSLLKNPQNTFPLIASEIATFMANTPQVRLAIIHGGGHHIQSALDQHKYLSTFIDGFRVTPKDHSKVVQEVLFDKLYPQFGDHLTAQGLSVTSWPTINDLPVRAQQKKDPSGLPLWGYVGDHITWDLDILHQLLNKQIVLLPSLALPEEDAQLDVQTLNINADDMAASLAIDLGAQKLIYITDVAGVLNSQKETLNHITANHASHLIATQVITDGMKLKIQQGFKALAQGVPLVKLCPLLALHQVEDKKIGTELSITPSQNAHSLMPTYQRKPLVFTSGQGPWLTTDTGDQYLDFVSGVAVNTLGHAHPKLAHAISEQASKLVHLSNLYYTPEQLHLADRLIALSQMTSVFFSNSGTEAVEAALKIARKFGKQHGAYKRKIIHLSHSFHGRTFGALTVTGNVHYQAPFLPLIGDTEEVPVGDLTALKRAMSEDVCAVILEPIQGESGVHPVDPAFIGEIRSLCDTYNALLIFDEVQSGIGRTGTHFYFEQLGIRPDVLCLAKGLGGGFPIGATLVNQKANCLRPGDHGSTFGGNPLACACANLILDTLMDEDLLQNATKLGNFIKEYYQKKDHPLIAGVTGSGLFLGLQLKTPAKDLIETAQAQKLLLIGAGTHTVRLLPPLNITQEVLKEGLKRLDSALEYALTLHDNLIKGHQVNTSPSAQL